MAITVKRVGYGQVEPNHLSAQKTGQIYAQLPAKTGIDLLENGQFVKYNYSDSVVDFAGAGEWMMVFNEVKIYDERKSYKDFAMVRGNYTAGSMVPRVIKINIGDIFTTNCIGAADASTELELKDKVAPGADGYLVKNEGATEYVFEVVKTYTMADGQPAVKLMRIA
jgi:hypothetical protein